MTTTMQFVRPIKGLPLTFLIVGECKDIFGGEGWLVKEYGFNKTFCVSKANVEPLTPSALMMEQINGWLHMIDFDPKHP